MAVEDTFVPITQMDETTLRYWQRYFLQRANSSAVPSERGERCLIIANQYAVELARRF